MTGLFAWISLTALSRTYFIILFNMIALLIYIRLFNVIFGISFLYLLLFNGLLGNLLHIFGDHICALTKDVYNITI